MQPQQKESLPPEDSDLIQYEDDGPSMGLIVIVGILGLATVGSLLTIATTDKYADQALENDVRQAKMAAIQEVATLTSQNPPNINAQLEKSVFQIYGLDRDSPFYETIQKACNITLLRNQLFDHDEDTTTPSHNLTVGLTISHCTENADHLLVKDGENDMVASIEGVDIFNEVENVKGDYAELVLLEFPAEHTLDLNRMVNGLPLSAAVPELSSTVIQTCGFQDGVKGQLCLETTLLKNKYGFEVVTPILSGRGASGSPYLYVNQSNPIDKGIIGVLSQIYRYTDKPYNFIATVGPNAQERIWRLIQTKMNSTKNFVDPYSQNYQSLPPTPVRP